MKDVGTTTDSSRSVPAVVNTGAPDADPPASDPSSTSNQPSGDSASVLFGLGIRPIVRIAAAVISAIAAVIGFIIKCRHYRRY